MTPTLNDMMDEDDYDGALVPVSEKIHRRKSRVRIKRRKMRFRRRATLLSLPGKDDSVEGVSFLLHRIFNLETWIKILIFTAILLPCICAFLYRANRKQRVIIKVLVQALDETGGEYAHQQYHIHEKKKWTSLLLADLKLWALSYSLLANHFGPALVI